MKIVEFFKKIHSFEDFAIWYFERFVPKNYIHVSQIEQKIYEARDDEARKYRKILDDELMHMLEKNEIEKRIETDSLKAHIKQLEKQLDETALLKKEVEKHELLNKKNAKMVLSNVIDFKYEVKKLLDMFAVASGKLDLLTGKASDHVDKIEE